MDGMERLFEWALGGIVAVGGWIIKRLHTRIDTIEKDVVQHKLDTANRCCTREELKQSIDAINLTMRDIWEAMNRMNDKLDGKADK